MELRAEWKRLEQRFAGHAAVAYKAIWNTLREQFGDVGITESFRRLEEIATGRAPDVDVKHGYTLMGQLAAEGKETGAPRAVMVWLMGKTLLKLIKLHTLGMRKIQGLNRKISNSLEQMTRPSHEVLDAELAQHEVKSRLAELSKIMEHQAAMLACLDLEVGSIRKLNTKMKCVISKLTNTSFKVFKSFGPESIGSSDDYGLQDGHTDTNDSGERGSERFHDHGDSPSNVDPSPRREQSSRTGNPLNIGDSQSSGDTYITNVGDSLKCGEFTKPIQVKPLYSDEVYDNGEAHAGINRTNSSESIPCSSWQSYFSTLFLPSSNPAQRPTESQTARANQPLISDEVPPRTAAPLSEQFEVYVRVVRAYQAQSKDELSLKVGQTLKQKTPAYSDGFAFGWTRAHRFAFKRKGFYPVDCVELISNDKKKD